MLRQPGAAAAAATGKEAKRLSDNRPFKIAAAEAAVPARLRTPIPRALTDRKIHGLPQEEPTRCAADLARR